MTKYEDDIVFNGSVSFGPGSDSPANTYTLPMYIDTIVSSTARRSYIAVPPGGDGEITSISLTPSANVATGPLTVLVGCESNGEVHIFSVSAGATQGIPVIHAVDAGDAPVSAGDAISFVVGGTNSAAGNANLAVTIRRAA